MTLAMYIYIYSSLSIPRLIGLQCNLSGVNSSNTHSAVSRSGVVGSRTSVQISADTAPSPTLVIPFSVTLCLSIGIRQGRLLILFFSCFSSHHAGVAVLMSPDIPLQLGLDSRQQFCLQSLPSMERLPLQYTVCVAHNVKTAHQEAVQQLSQHSRELPNMRTLWSVTL